MQVGYNILMAHFFIERNLPREEKIVSFQIACISSIVLPQLTSQVLKRLRILLDQLKADKIELKVETLVSLVIAYLPYVDKKPDDTVVSTLRLLKSCLAKLVDQPSLWIKTLPGVLEAVSDPYMFHLFDTSTLYNYIVAPIMVYTHSFGIYIYIYSINLPAIHKHLAILK
jgi:hypothetical protein